MNAAISIAWARILGRLAMGVALAFLAIAPSAAAASVQAALDRETIALGDTAVLKVTVEGGSGRDTPSIPEVNGLRFTLSGNGMSFSFLNGRQSIISEITYTVTATRVGTYTIGPITTTVGGQLAQSTPLQLTVVPANDPRAARNDGLDQAAFLRLVVPDREVYVGESFVVEIHLYATGGRLQQAPQLTAEGFTLGKLQDGGQQGNVRVNNRPYTRARFLQTVTAARAGDLFLQAANCVLDIPVSRRGGGNDPFADIFNLRETRRLTLASEPAALRVAPLPRQGMPPGFNGAVGDFQLAVSAGPTNLNAGDPITVRIDIQGRGNFDSVQLPEQPAWRGFRLYPPTSELKTDESSEITGSKHFEQIVTPESADLTSLPSFVFSFFHPESKTYKTLRSAAIPLKVAAGAAGPELPEPAGTGTSGTARKPDIAPLKPHLGTVVVRPAPWIRQPWFLALAIAPPVLWLALKFRRAWRERRAADRESLRRADLEKRISKGLHTLQSLAREGTSDEFFVVLFRTLQESVALRTGEAPASITEGSLDSDAVRAGLPPEAVDALHRLFQTCNQARYARVGSVADLAALQAEASQLSALLRSAA
ncbi:MAG: BatD family protein [Limisphaerales bacterium]